MLPQLPSLYAVSYLDNEVEKVTASLDNLHLTAPAKLHRTGSLKGRSLQPKPDSSQPFSYTPTFAYELAPQPDQESVTKKKEESERCVKKQTDRYFFELHRFDFAPWMLRGRVEAYPHSIVFEKLELTGKFLDTGLGKRAVRCIEKCLSLAQCDLSFFEFIEPLSTFLTSACLGHSYALLMAFAKVKKVLADDLLQSMDKVHVLFFQVLEATGDAIRAVKKLPLPAETARTISRETFNASMEVIKEATECEVEDAETITLSLPYSVEKIQNVIEHSQQHLIEIGYYYKNGVNNHSNILFCMDKIAFYDIAAGFCSFHSRADAIADLTRYIMQAVFADATLQSITIQRFSFPNR